MKKNITLSLIRRLARYSHPLLQVLETRSLHKYESSSQSRQQPVFIIGAPRTGSTILYQLLTHCFDVLYINNLISLFYRDLFTGFRISIKLLGNHPHHCFQSHHGNTLQCGARGPSECGDLWYRWLPRDRHYIGKNQLSPDKREEIHQVLYGIINRWNRPLVIKNLNAGQRMGLISQVAPEARFIFIKRPPLYTAQSIWASKQRAGIRPDQWWSIMPENYQNLSELPAHRQVVHQVYYLEKQIMQDREFFPASQFTTIDYDALCRDPEGTVNRLREFLGPDVQLRKNATIPTLKLNQTQTIANRDLELLKKEINRLDWENYQT